MTQTQGLDDRTNQNMVYQPLFVSVSEELSHCKGTRKLWQPGNNGTRKKKVGLSLKCI